MRRMAAKKMYPIDTKIVRAARRGLGAKTDTEAITNVLQKVVCDVKAARALDRFLREGRFRTIYR